MRSIPTLEELRGLFATEEECRSYLGSKNAFYQTLPCSQCGNDMRRILEKGVFRCGSRSCGHREQSLRKHTFFYGSHLKCIDILRMGHLWLSGASHSTVTILTGHTPETVTAFFRHFRNLVVSALDVEDQVIGGPGIDVEVDETKLGKRKYNRGHRVDGVWVAVGIERTPERRIFLVPLEDRSAETLDRVICDHVAEGSIVHTDCWASYRYVTEHLGLEHRTVNHSRGFVDLVTGACTNHAEGLNSGLKRKIPVRNRVRSGIEGHLGEYIWRAKNHDGLWDAFIRAIEVIHYDIQ